MDIDLDQTPRLRFNHFHLTPQVRLSAGALGKARRSFFESKSSHASGTAELGSCLTDATREGRSRRAVRGVPL